MDPTERSKKAFDRTSDTTKQLITLATGITGLTVTFAKDIFVGEPDWSKWILAAAWGGYLVSVVFGLIALYALIGTLASTSDEAVVTGKNVTSPVKMQQTVFLFATVAIVAFGVVAVV